ncbi:MAG TPA: RNA polymerase sigma factor [Polyangia bacterium]
MTILEGKALLDHSKSIARRHLGRVDGDTADDLGAEAMLRALRSPPPDGHLQPWLERIFHNLFVDRWRRRQPEVASEDFSHFAAVGTPEDQLLLRERRQAVRAKLAQLPRDARRALLARYYGELSAEDAAARLGIAPATVRTRIHRSLRQLRELLGDMRAWFPPGIAHLVGTKTSALALIPVAVAVLALGEINPPRSVPPQSAGLSPLNRVAQPGLVAKMEKTAVVTPVAIEPKIRPRIARTPTPAAPVFAHTPITAIDTGEDEEVVGHVQHPEVELIVSGPSRADQPSLIEAPTDFAAQFEKMVEDRM